MDVIPVIDVARGRVVRAVKGERASYRPIDTPLAKDTSEPADIARSIVFALDQPSQVQIAEMMILPVNRY